MTWRSSDVLDYTRFPAFEFKASQQPFVFPTKLDPSLDQLSVPQIEKKSRPLLQTLQNSETTAFILIQHDTVRYEKYFSEYERSSVNTSFSVAKSITSLLVGKALDEGLIESINDPVTDYLPELRNQDPLYDEVTIHHLLNMRSGIQFKDHDLPWGDKPKAYYHPRLRDRIHELPVDFEPGSRFQYNSYNPIVAGMILEKVTQQSPAQYFQENIWNQLGMEYDGSWSVDSEESRMTKMESGINLRAIDFAKLGRLVLHRGNWNGKQVVSESWIQNIGSVSQENQVAELGDEIYYGRFWWLYSKDKQEAYIISGWGHLGQYLFLFPQEEAIVVRMGKKLGGVESWKKVAQQVVFAANK